MIKKLLKNKAVKGLVIAVICACFVGGVAVVGINAYMISYVSDYILSLSKKIDFEIIPSETNYSSINSIKINMEKIDYKELSNSEIKMRIESLKNEFEAKKIKLREICEENLNYLLFSMKCIFDFCVILSEAKNLGYI